VTSGIKSKIGLYNVGNSPTKQLCTRKIAKTVSRTPERTIPAEKCPKGTPGSLVRECGSHHFGQQSAPQTFQGNCHDRLMIRPTQLSARILFDTLFLRRL
jgi:hypothetical protein